MAVKERKETLENRDVNAFIIVPIALFLRDRPCCPGYLPSTFQGLVHFPISAFQVAGM